MNELRKYKIAIAAIQKTRRNKLTPQIFTSNGYSIFTSSLANNHEFGTDFLVDSKFNHMVINFTPINERLFVVGRETINQPTIGKHSLQESTNENGLRLVDFAAGRKRRSKVRTSCTNESTSKPGTPKMDTPSTRSITA
jgi:hypothetical protein